MNLKKLKGINNKKILQKMKVKSPNLLTFDLFFYLF